MDGSPSASSAQSSSGAGTSGDSTPTNVLDFQKSVNKRLDAMTDRQDSIQALSLWMIHHKIECQKIAACWLAAMKRAKIARRLYLFYLANDVVQSCKKKNAKIYLLAFKNVLKDAVVLVRDASVKHKIERIFHIWEERNTYFVDFVQELRELLNDREKVTAHVSATNFKPQDVLESIRKVKMLETHVGMKQKQVANLKLDASKIEAVKQLKDRSHSHDFARQFDDSYTKMQGYVKMLENEVDQRSKLINLLENGQTFYEVQNDDAMVVANAYRNFGIRINNLKKRLVDYKDTLDDDTDSPIPSPSAEAPSPGSTPPNDDTDDQEGMDMELSDTDDVVAGKIIAAEPYTPSAAKSLSDRISAMGGTVPGADPRQSIKLENAGSYSPAEQLQRERGGAETTATKPADHTFLFSMVAAKTQATAGRQGKSVLKDLTEFAEKVKNPPPKDWSEFNKKRLEKAKAQEAEEVAARQIAAKQVAERALAEQAAQQGAQQTTQQPDADEEYVPSPLPSTAYSGSYYESSPQYSQSIASEESLHSATASQADTSLGEQGQQPNSVAGSELHSISWPPRNSPSLAPARTEATEPAITPSQLGPQHRARLPSPIRPPMLRPALATAPTQPAPHMQVRAALSPQRPVHHPLKEAPHITIQEPLRPAPHIQVHQPAGLAQHIQVNQPLHSQHSQQLANTSMRTTNTVVSINSAPPPPPPEIPAATSRSISTDEQQDALDLLDCIHAAAGTSNNTAQKVRENAPEQSMQMDDQGSAIQTLGKSYTISPIVNRMNPAVISMNRPPVPPTLGYNNYTYDRPPAKRPYQQYGSNYPYY